MACPRQARQVPQGGEVVSSYWHIRRIQNLILVARTRSGVHAKSDEALLRIPFSLSIKNDFLWGTLGR